MAFLARRRISRSGEGDLFRAGDTAVLINPSTLRLAFWSGLLPAVNVKMIRVVW